MGDVVLVYGNRTYHGSVVKVNEDGTYDVQCVEGGELREHVNKLDMEFDRQRRPWDEMQ